MKFTVLVFAAMLAVASAEATAASPSPQEIEDYCNSSGQPCDKFKRAAELIGAANMEPRSPHRHCYRPGEPCYKAKRDAAALADALAAAHVDSEPDAAPGTLRPHAPSDYAKRLELMIGVETSEEYCNSEHGPCTKVKRAKDHVVDWFKPKPGNGPHRHCYRPGEPCYKRKRALDALAAAAEKI